MSLPTKIPYLIEDKFMLLDGLSCNGIIYDNMNDPVTKRMFYKNDGKYCSYNGNTAVIIGKKMYVSPFKNVVPVLESYGFEKGSFTVPFSNDMYTNFPHAFDKETYMLTLSNNIEDPLSALETAYNRLFHSIEFQKWRQLLRVATREDGYPIDIERHIKLSFEMYKGPENVILREQKNHSLREMMKDYFKDNKELVQKIEQFEKSRVKKDS